MKKSKKVVSSKERELRRQRAQAKEIQLMYKLLFVTVAMIIGIAAVLTISKTGANTVAFLTKAQFPLMIVFGVLTALSAVYFIINKVKAVDESGRVVTSTSLFALSIIAFCLVASYIRIDIAYDMWRIIALIVLGALYFVYHIYDCVFFTVSAQCASAVFAVSILSKTSLSLGIRVAIAIAAIALCSIGAYFLCRFLTKSEAVKDYKLLIMTAIIIAGALLSLLIPAITSYAVFAILAVFVVIAVISTIELM